MTKWWLFTPRVDVAVFLGSAAVALGLVALGIPLGLLHADSPGWLWIAAILLIDVAHVWSTLFRVYLDPIERARRLRLYISVPALCWLGGILLYQHSALTFWRVLAYAAVFHFVRQQYGWVALYRARLGETNIWTKGFDSAVIYAATVFPLLWWHAHLPRNFSWFVPGDFVSAAPQLLTLATPLYWGLMIAYATKSLYGWLRHRRGNPGKDMIVSTTAICWYVGIVAINSDYAFTLTNVIIHGVPYFALIYWYGRTRATKPDAGAALALLRTGPWALIAITWLLAYGEELLWDGLVWHERPWLFGLELHVEHALPIVVPLLAVPQATHYILDGFVWRRRGNPGLRLFQ